MAGSPTRPPRPAEVDAFYQALSELARSYQFRSQGCGVTAGVSVTECHALEAVLRSGTLSVNGIARELRLDKSTASRTVAELERRGLLARSDDPDEHRAWRVRVTANGRRVHRRIVGTVMADYRPLLASLSPARRREAIAFLGEVARRTRERIGRTEGRP